MSKSTLGLLVAVAVILLMVFGHSPMESWKQKAAKKRGDRLVNAIMEEAGTKKTNPNLTGLSNGGDTSLDKMSDAPVNNRNSGGRSSFTPTQISPTINLAPLPQNVAPQRQQPPEDDYYPPVVGQKPGPQSNNRLFRQGRGIFIDSASKELGGAEVISKGARVYTIDASGTVAPLKDGNYPMLDGAYIMKIRGGEKMVF